MRRRNFIVAVVSIVSAMPLVARGQSKVRPIAILGPAEEPRFSEMVAGLRRGLRDLGYAAPELIEAKVARGDAVAVQAQVEHAVRQDAAVLFVIGSELAKMARPTAPNLPFVFVTPGDPVAAGIVTSLSRPGGNTTAMTFEFPELSAKRLELLNALAPRVRRVIVLYDPRDASPVQGLAAAREAAPKLGLTLSEHEARSDADVLRGIESMDSADAVLAIPGGITSAHYPAIIRVANEKRRPTFFHSRAAAAGDALASYGASDVNIAREAARLIHKIINGERAGELPVERPTKFEFVINLKTAKRLDIDVPPTLLARADEVIE